MSLVRKFSSVGGATMASRVLGFVREAMIAAFLGAGPVADAFYAAFRFPNLFRRLFAEGAFNSAFIPLFGSELETGGRAAARDFAEKIMAVLLLTLLLLSVLAIIFMPYLVGTIIAPKFAEDPEKFELTVFLARIMFPYLAAMSVVAMLSGILNAFRKYFLAAMAPVLLNVIFILVLVTGGFLESGGSELAVAMAWGVVVSGVVQVGLLVYAVRREGFGLSIRMPRVSPAVRRLLILALPTAVANGITQINLLVGQIIASAQEGAIAIMNYADRLAQLPLGIIGISIGVVLLPELSRALAAKDQKEANHLQNRSMEVGLGISIPAAVGLFMIPLPLVALVFERGAFDRETSIVTAQVLSAFAIGIPSFVLIKILHPSFYARQDMRTPMWFSGINAILNIILSLLLFPIYGVVGLAIATSAAGWLNAILLAASLHLGRHFRVSGVTLRNLLLVLLANLAMAGLIYLADLWLGRMLVDGSLLVRVFLVGGVIAASAAFYGGVVVATGAIPRSQLKAVFRRR